MITIGHHPTLQRLLDEWKSSLRLSHSDKVPVCSVDDLRRLISSLEDEYDAIAERLDSQHQVPLRQLFKMNCEWFRYRIECSLHILQQIVLRTRK